MEQSAQHWIDELNLQPHPEGGFYAEVFRAEESVQFDGKERSALTSIYYLLEKEDFSGFHRIGSPELWYFHAGSPITIHVLHPSGKLESITLSHQKGHQLQCAVPAGAWFSAEIPSKEGYVLVSCAVAPGFEFWDFEMADNEVLKREFGEHGGILGRLCR